MPGILPTRRNCGAMIEHRKLLNENPAYVAARSAIENKARARQRGLLTTARVGITRIPVVVHVVWNTEEQNISDEQIQSQIDVLNQDYRMNNLDITEVPAVWQSVAADTRVEFFLAMSDPDGNPTKGITRTQTELEAFPQEGNPVKFATEGGADAWPADRYLNIWVAPRITSPQGDLLGYAQFPGGPANTDGVVILHSAFGTTGTAAAPFDRGRTATHEIGHWLNLNHIWGDDGTGCGGTDEVADTPNTAGPNYGCPTFPNVTCDNGPDGDMFMNFMDYTDDACMYMFTAEQVARMQATLDGPRVLIESELYLVLLHFGYEQGDWRVDKHPRFLADLTASGRADIIGFGGAGVYTALTNGDGSFQDPQLVLSHFGYEAEGGEWRVEQHPRFLADLTGSGRADIIGFGGAGVYTALSNGDGTFQEPQLVLSHFGHEDEGGGWRVDNHPRFLADLTGSGRADIIGFGGAGVYTALSNGDGTFQEPQLVLSHFGFEPEGGDWRVDQHPRFLADLTGSGRADIIGFGGAGVYTALSNGDGTFQEPQLVLSHFGFEPEGGDWRVNQHPRFLADLTGSGRADIIGFGGAGVYTALSNGDGTFQEPQLIFSNFGYEGRGWRVEQHPRFLADLTGSGCADIVGFGEAGVWVALSNCDGTFSPAQTGLGTFRLGPTVSSEAGNPTVG